MVLIWWVFLDILIIMVMYFVFVVMLMEVFDIIELDGIGLLFNCREFFVFDGMIIVKKFLLYFFGIVI